MYICVYVCMYVYIQVVGGRMYVHMYVCMYVYIQVVGGRSLADSLRPHALVAQGLMH